MGMLCNEVYADFPRKGMPLRAGGMSALGPSRHPPVR